MLYTVTAASKASITDTVKERDDLGRSIFALAAKNNEQIWFHDFTDLVAGAPVILLECSEDFLAKVKTLPGCAEASEYAWSLTTQRSAQIYNYFAAPGKPPRPPKTPGAGM